MTAPRLLHFRVSHYNEKVRWALDHKKWPHVLEALVPGFHVPRVRRLTGQNKVPVLVIDGIPINGSGRILQEIERIRPNPPLLTESPADRARALALEAFFDDEVAPDVRRLFWSTYLDRPTECVRMATDGASSLARGAWWVLSPLLRRVLRFNMQADTQHVERAREMVGGFFDRLESEIGPSGYLVGDAFGIADLAVASVLSPILRPPEFPYPVPEPWPPGLVELRASLAGRAGYRWVMDMYARHRGTSSEVMPLAKT